MVNSATSTIARLHLVSDQLPGGVFELTGERIGVGRDRSNIICLDHITVSLHHAILVRVGEHYKVRDLISTNGTYVNDQRTTGAQLQSGDRLRCGEIEMRYEELRQPVTEPETIRSRSVLALGRWRSGVTPVEAPAAGENAPRSWPKRAGVLFLLVLACGGASWWFEQWPFGAQGPLKQFARSAELRVYLDPIYAAASAAEDGKDYAKLLENATLLAGRYPNSGLAQYILGVAYGKLGFFPDAAAAFQQAIKLKPDFVDAWNNLGWAYSQSGKLAEAVAVFRQLLKLTPNDAQVWNSLGRACAAQGHEADAVTAYQTAIRLKPDYAEAHFNLGAACAHQGKPVEAVNAFRLALKYKPDFPEAWFNLGVISEQQGQDDEAVLFFQRAIKLQPDYAEAWGGLVKTYLNLHQTDKAGEAAREMKRLDPAKADQLAEELSREAPPPAPLPAESE